jgi:DNA-binding SARP family transcriptional activator
VLEEWDGRGAALLATIGFVKLGVLALDHKSRIARRVALVAIRRVRGAGVDRYLRWWLRRYVPDAQWLARHAGGIGAILELADADPTAWRDTIAALLPRSVEPERQGLLGFLERHATMDTIAALRAVDGQDVLDLRRILVSKHASRLYIRSFGALAIHQGSWHGTTSTLDKRRMRALLALLVANFRSTLTRDMALDVLWPEADPASAVNSLNQAVFQLRRVLDPGFRDGESPPYVLSSVDSVHLNPDLVVTDLDDFRRIAAEVSKEADPRRPEQIASLVDIVRGEFLAELRYEDWAVRSRTAVHAEVREVLLPIAVGDLHANSDLAVRAASSLLELDPYDEAAHLGLARQLHASGRRTAAHAAILRFVKKLRDDLDESPSEEIAAALEGWGLPRSKSTGI